MEPRVGLLWSIGKYSNNQSDLTMKDQIQVQDLYITSVRLVR